MRARPRTLTVLAERPGQHFLPAETRKEMLKPHALARVRKLYLS